MRFRILLAVCAVLALNGSTAAQPNLAPLPAGPSAAEILEASPQGDWRPLDPQDTVYMDLPAGRVVIELAPAMAPRTVANIKAMIRQGYFDGLAILRSQDNYVVQWGDPDSAKPLDASLKTAKPEFTRSSAGLSFHKLAERDVYADEVGFVGGMPAARDPASGETWLTHCYGMVGVGRDSDPSSGGGSELYAVIGHAPRHLDRNIALVGRVVQGMEHLSTIPRGPGPMGFYEKAEARTPIRRVRLAADLPAAERLALEALRTDRETFTRLTDARRQRRDGWSVASPGRIELCNVQLPVRTAP